MAESDEERAARDEQMRKLRMSGSSSPSALSTASSGSPLVRNSSGSSQQRLAGRRVAPTSIAAAQLQQQLEFTNRLPARNEQQNVAQSNLRKDSKMPKGSSWPTEKDGGAQASGKKRHKLAASAKLDNSTNNSAAAQKQAQAAREQNGAERHKSLGYNVAKSIAFRVYRVNEFWTVNKMRYMNLACLLMTLVCLVTILLFAGSNNNNNQADSAPDALGAARLALKRQQLQELAEEAESVDSANSQPLVASAPNSSEAPPIAASQQADSFDEPADEQRPAKVARKSGVLGQAKAEREVEETTPSSEPADGNNVKNELAGIVEPLLGQLLQDLELGPLFKAVRRAAGNTTGSIFGKPLVKRTRNGATIIFSASSPNLSAPLNQSSPPGSSFPALLQRLLPPLFRPDRPASLGRLFPSSESAVANSSATSGGVATITIGAEPMVLASSRLGPFGDQFAAPSGDHARPSGGGFLMSSDPFSFRSPFAQGPLLGPSPLMPMMAPLGPPPSLLSMLMRASTGASPLVQDSSDDSDGPFARFPVAVVAAPASMKNESSSQTAGSNSTQAPANATSETAAAAVNQSKPADPEVETFDVSQLKPAASRTHAHTLYPARGPKMPHSAGSMLIFSSGGLEGLPARDPFQFPFGAMMSPFMGAAPPHMMLIGAGGQDGAEMAPASGPLNPILRSILSNVMLDSVAPPGDAEKNKTERNSANKAETSRMSESRGQMGASSQPGSSWSDLDDDWAPHGHEVERWDERADQAGSSNKQLRARHRQASAELEAESALEQVDHDSLPTQYDSATGGQPARFHEGVVQGTIRQTIRGPGMTVERIIEMPANRIVREQVGPGVRSQSLSRADFGDEDTPPAMSVRPAASAFMNPFGRAMTSTAQALAAERAESSDTFMGPPAGFIGKLLADIARRSDRAEARSSNGHKSRLLAFNDEDFDEADSLSEPQNASGSAKLMAPVLSSALGPKIRVASARVRVRPAHMAAASGAEPAFFAPPAHFTLAASDNSLENEKEAGAGPAPASGLFSGFGDASKLASSFEDTMNSMEDRLNHVLSMAGVNPSANSTPAQKQKAADEAAEMAKKTQPAPSRLALAPQNAAAKQTNQPQQADGEQKQVSAAFTSPSSPLFGFPALPQAPVNNNEPSAAAKQEAAPRGQKQASASNNNRQQRSFTYHSNNEIAKPLLPAANQQQQHHHHHHQHHQQQQQQARSELPLAAAESSAQPKFIPLSSASASVFGPPARMVLGRRLDEQTEQEPSAELSVGPSAAPNALVGRAFRPPHNEPQQQAMNLQENYKTIVV